MPDLLGPLEALRATSGDTSAARKSLILHVAISFRVIDNLDHRSLAGSGSRRPRWQAWWMHDMAHECRDWKHMDITWSKACILGRYAARKRNARAASARASLLKPCSSEPYHLIRRQVSAFRQVT
jgi:hypothetical protein